MFLCFDKLDNNAGQIGYQFLYKIFAKLFAKLRKHEELGSFGEHF